MELKLDRNGLIDLDWCRQAQSRGAIRLGYPAGISMRHDASDDGSEQLIEDASVPLARDLNFVLQTVRDNYRPTKWAQVFGGLIEAVPDWAENWEISKIVGTGSIKPAGQLGPVDVPKGDFSRSTTTGRMIEMINGYGYFNRELIRAARLGVNPSVERAMAQAQAADEFMDQLCCTGDSFGLGFTGIGNNSDVAGSLVVGTTKSTTTSWTAATTADYDLVLRDCHALTDAPYVASKERRISDTMLLPLDEYQALNRLRPANYSENALTTFMREWQAKAGKPVRMVVWDRLAAIGSISSGPRLVAFDSNRLVVALMQGKAYGVDQVLEVPRGFEAFASLVTGGVRILDQSGIRYLDINA
jgi:hypothetical protein